MLHQVLAVLYFVGRNKHAHATLDDDVEFFTMVAPVDDDFLIFKVLESEHFNYEGPVAMFHSPLLKELNVLHIINDLV